LNNVQLIFFNAMTQKTRRKIKKVKAKKTVKKRKAKNHTFDFEDKVRKISVKVIGIGGGANSIVSEIAPRISKGRVRFVVANTDLQDLVRSSRNPKVKRFQFGEESTYGLGTGMNVDLGERAALAQVEKIKKLLTGADLCIIVTCLGGGAGSGAAPVFAKVSRKLGNITYGIFTLPFAFEGGKKMEIARNSLLKIKPFVNAFSVIPNERIFKFIDKKTPLKEALSIVNKSLTQGLEGLIKMIYSPGVVNIDFADFRTTMDGKEKLTYLSTTEVGGETRAETISQKVLSNPLYSYSISGARRVLFNITSGSKMGLSEVAMISDKIFSSVKKGAKIIFGISRDSKMTNNIRVTVLAVGCKGGDLFQEEKRNSARGVSSRVKEPPLVNKQAKEETKKSAESKQKKTHSSKVFPKKKKKSKPAARPIKKKSRKKTTLRLLKEKKKTKKEAKLRRNAIEVQKAAEEVEKEILRQEEVWDSPAFLRKEKELGL